MSQRFFLMALLTLVTFWPGKAPAQAPLPTDNPMSALGLACTDALPWNNVVSINNMPGDSADAKLHHAQEKLAGTGGVIYFPAGTYVFRDHIKLKSGMILRGAPPASRGKADAQTPAPTTRFEFPRYVPKFDGKGTPNDTAFKGIYVADPATTSKVGVVDLDIQRGHIRFEHDGSEAKKSGRERFVFGCVLRNTAVPDPAVPNEKIGQHAWQRFTLRHFAAISVYAEEHAIVAYCRLPKSGEENFTMKGYVLLGKDRKSASFDGVEFDYDNRPGIYVNHFGIGGPGGSGPDGTPDTHPYGFRKGNVIKGNYVYATGRTCIGFCGDGTRCEDNVIRIPDNIYRPTATGQALTFGASTNDNRAVEMRGWRWVVSGNDFEIHRNLSSDKIYRINDGEGLMHEDHVNSTVKDSVVKNNKGNAYISIFHTAGIDGLVVEGNEIRIPKTASGIEAIYVAADRHKTPFECKNVRIENNTVAGTGILILGQPSSNNLIRNNRWAGEGQGKLTLRANADIQDNKGFEIIKK